MTVREKQLRSDRPLAAGDEAGTTPEDRPFRPDVEGLRAVAVLLVVLFHSGVSWVSGGYVGVDVFFVISGFVITGVLLRERASSGRTSIFAFYGRRCRRIIPAATLVIIATVVLAYWFLGVAGGSSTATDGRWAAVFLANFHFIAIGTNYFSSQQPPSPLQNFWSLAVEEQFYVVYPTLFLVVARREGALPPGTTGHRPGRGHRAPPSPTRSPTPTTIRSMPTSPPSPGPGSWPSVPWWRCPPPGS